MVDRNVKKGLKSSKQAGFGFANIIKSNKAWKISESKPGGTMKLSKIGLLGQLKDTTCIPEELSYQNKPEKAKLFYLRIFYGTKLYQRYKKHGTDLYHVLKKEVQICTKIENSCTHENTRLCLVPY